MRGLIFSLFVVGLVANVTTRATRSVASESPIQHRFTRVFSTSHSSLSPSWLNVYAQLASENVISRSKRRAVLNAIAHNEEFREFDIEGLTTDHDVALRIDHGLSNLALSLSDSEFRRFTRNISLADCDSDCVGVRFAHFASDNPDRLAVFLAIQLALIKKNNSFGYDPHTQVIPGRSLQLTADLIGSFGAVSDEERKEVVDMSARRSFARTLDLISDSKTVSTNDWLMMSTLLQAMSKQEGADIQRITNMTFAMMEYLATLIARDPHASAEQKASFLQGKHVLTRFLELQPLSHGQLERAIVKALTNPDQRVTFVMLVNWVSQYPSHVSPQARDFFARTKINVTPDLVVNDCTEIGTKSEEECKASFPEFLKTLKTLKSQGYPIAN